MELSLIVVAGIAPRRSTPAAWRQQAGMELMQRECYARDDVDQDGCFRREAGLT